MQILVLERSPAIAKSGLSAPLEKRGHSARHNGPTFERRRHGHHVITSTSKRTHDAPGPAHRP
jgi:hypothetical protein